MFHKVLSAVVGAVVLITGYYGSQVILGSDSVTRYILAQVQKDTIVVSVSGSGQVEVSDQVDIKSKASGDVLWVGVSAGAEVYAGQLIAQLNDREAQKSVRDAEASLESARISFEKLVGTGATPKNKLQAEEDLRKAYDDGFNAVSNAFLDLPSVMSGLDKILFGNDSSFSGGNQQNIDFYASAVLPYGADASIFKTDAYNKYKAARSGYDKTFGAYKAASRSSSETVIEDLINSGYVAVKTISESVKSSTDLIQFYNDKLTERNVTLPALAATYLGNLNMHTATVNKHLSALLSAKNAIKNSKDALENADLDIRSQQLLLRQKENALLDAKEKLADYYIRAPFSGTVAKINIQKADSVGNGTVAATLVTKQKFAEISLNEVDVAKIKLGQKVDITFDAVEGLSIAGVVSEIDALGTVSQGVVTYNVKITFDTQDDRVKPGMSLTASITTEVKSDVLAVPAGAVKLRGNAHFVSVFDDEVAEVAGMNRVVNPNIAPREQRVEVGISNDTLTEIISGLSEGDQIVGRVISAQVAPAQSAPSLFGASGGNRVSGGGSGNATRIVR